MRHVTELWDSEAQNNNLLIPAAEATEKAEHHCNVFVSYRKSPRRAQFILIQFSAHQVKKKKRLESHNAFKTLWQPTLKFQCNIAIAHIHCQYWEQQSKLLIRLSSCINKSNKWLAFSQNYFATQVILKTFPTRLFLMPDIKGTPSDTTQIIFKIEVHIHIVNYLSWRKCLFPQCFHT